MLLLLLLLSLSLLLLLLLLLLKNRHDRLKGNLNLPSLKICLYLFINRRECRPVLALESV